MPAAAGWGAAQDQVSPGGKFFPFRGSFHCNPCPGGEAAQTAEPSWCLTASLLPSCSLPAGHCLFNAFKLHNLLSLLCCSSTWIMGAKKKKRQATEQGQSTEKGQGWEGKAGTQGRCIWAALGRFVRGCSHREFGKGRAQHHRGNHTLSHRLGVPGAWFHKRILPPHQRPFLFLGHLSPPSSAGHPVWWCKSYPGTKFRVLDN